MNEFIEQFLIESRELIEQATADLLALEKAPDDEEHIDSAFRTFHTLKGGAGIVDFAAMAQAVHAAEDVLSSARSKARSITTQIISDCLKCLDQIVRWLDTIEITGDLPKHAEAEADVIVARFASSQDGVSATTLPMTSPSTANWTERLLAQQATLCEQAQTAIRYAPGSNCFYEGQDPLARIATLPGLLWVGIEPVSSLPQLDALDPFTCNLVLTALTISSPIEVADSMGDAVEQCDIQALVNRKGSNLGLRVSEQARQILEEQILLIDEMGVSGAAGRMASTGVVAANVLRNAGQTADADAIERASKISLAENAPRFLREAIRAALSGAVKTTVFSDFPSPLADREKSARTLRIDTARIDALVNLIGELTVVKNSFGHAAQLAQQGDSSVSLILKQRYLVLDRLVGELQQSVLGIRVLPLRHVFQRFPRLLREISSSLAKPANLVIEGGDTEADKAIVEMLFEPILHVLRNAMDHGIEEGGIRTAHGKPPVATIRISACRQGEHIIVEVSDDGRGVDVVRVRQVALQRKVVPAEVLSAMGDDEAMNLIFEPGFSTAGEVTALSGRGVGMDAVCTAVERMAGRVAIESRAGHGTTVRLTLPFSVMLTRVMVVGAGDQTFGIPLDAVVETLRIDSATITPIGAAQAIVLRNRTIPLVVLAGALGLKMTKDQESEATIVVVKIGGQHGALRVDRIGERMAVMLKPLDGLLVGIRGLAGSTLLGDGSVLLVLDITELFQ